MSRSGEAESRQVGAGGLARGQRDLEGAEADDLVLGQAAGGLEGLVAALPGHADGVGAGAGLLLPVDLVLAEQVRGPGRVPLPGHLVDARAEVVLVEPAVLEQIALGYVLVGVVGRREAGA